MAYSKEKGSDDIIISGFEKGIADSPESGIADIRSANITSVPGEISTSFATTAGILPPAGTGISFSEASGTFTVANTTNYYDGMAVELASTSLPNQMSFLAVGGGGGGGSGVTSSDFGGGGGGAGQVNYQTSIPVTTGTYSIVVGGGGSTAGSGVSAGNGGSSSITGTGITTVTAIGGGGGGSSTVGASGGSGGGGSANNAGGAGTSGFAGGNGGGPSASGGGGGGGSGQIGSNGGSGNPSGGGSGGNGTANSISGSSVTYAGGGGGGSVILGAGGTGGTGGGGQGAGTGGGQPATAGTANTGSGGGGGEGNTSGSTTGAAGGSGIVIISYPTGTFTTSGGTMTTSGSNTIVTFTTSGTFTVTAVNPQANQIYFIGNLGSTTFKLYYDATLTNVLTPITNFTGTYNIPRPTQAVFSTMNGLNGAVVNPVDNAIFMIDNTGNAWFIPTQTLTYTGGTVTMGSVQYTGNIGHSSTGTNLDFGIAVWNNYLFVFINESIDYLKLSTGLFGSGGVSGWVYGWKNNLNQTSYEHQALVAIDGNLYICNGITVASLVLQSGLTTFDPTNTATYTWNPSAIILPTTDAAQCIGQLTSQLTLLIGGVGNNIYIFSFANPTGNYTNVLVCADASAYRIVGTNSNAYIFSGTRGRIYVTNGSSIQLYKKIPDALSGNPEPYYKWGDAIYFRNKLYFTFTATSNAGTSLANTGGIWALGIDAGQTTIQFPTAGSLFNTNQLSYGTYGGSSSALFTFPSPSAPGYGVGAWWLNSTTVGVDMPTSLPYTGGQTYFETDLMAVGTRLEPQTFKQIEYKLSKPLVTGESVQILWRSNLNTTYQAVPLQSLIGKVSSISSRISFEKVQWVQFKCILTSTPTTPSYTRLTQLRLR